MSKYKVKNSIWFVIFESLRIYFTNIDKFLTYMLFPVFGQILGIILSFGLSLGFANLIVERVDNPITALVLVLLLATPGLLIFVKAFWDFMVAYVALNSMTEGAITSGKVYDFRSHNEVATQRLFQFIILLCLVNILSSAIITSVLLIIPGFILWIYFILVYQIFTFEPDLQIHEIFKRSFCLIRGNWLRTCILLALLTFFSIYIITQGISVVFDYLNITDFICSLFNPVSYYLPLEFINKVLQHFNQPIITVSMISRSIFFSILTFIITGLTLPIRSISWTIWYLVLEDLDNKNNSARNKKSKKYEEEDY